MPIISYGLDARALTQGTRTVLNELGKITNKASNVASSIGSMFSPLKLAIAGGIGGIGVSQLSQVGDAYVNMAGQLKYLTGSAEAAEEAQKGLYQMSQDTRTSMLENAKALTRFELASEQTGLTTQQNIDVLGGINKLLLQTGVSSAEASAGMMQLGQALASGRLQGDEFRSLSENMPALMNELAKSLGLTRTELKQMASEGELTSEVLGNAFLSITETLGNEELPLTVSGMWTKITNAMQRAWDIINDKTGLLKWVAEGFDNLSFYIEENTDEIVLYVLNMKDKFLSYLPEIKEFFYQLGNIAVNMSNMFIDSWPYVESFLSGTGKLITWLIPYVKQLVEWIGFLIDKMVSLAQYTPLLVAAKSYTSTGSVVEAAKSVFDPENYGSQESQAQTQQGSNSGNTTVLNFNGEYSKSDVVNIATDLDRQNQRL